MTIMTVINVTSVMETFEETAPISQSSPRDSNLKLFQN